MITAVDTNVLLDVLIPNARYARASKHALEDALAQGVLIIGEVVYAELASWGADCSAPAHPERFSCGGSCLGILYSRFEDHLSAR